MSALVNLALFAALVWAAYKAWNADNRDDASFYIVIICLPIILSLCGVHFSDMDSWDY